VVVMLRSVVGVMTAVVFVMVMVGYNVMPKEDAVSR
jgi:hypothetical protein